ncbi:MAG: two-CW domain-containing protein [Thermodesulfobacteriota bacterium]|jgi:hypothetical protein
MNFKGKEQCWQRLGCGRDRQKDCPAYPDYGRLCWPIAGTKCPTGARGTHAQEIKNCESCEFFHSVVYAGMTDS